jgi:hypothetical protein
MMSEQRKIKVIPLVEAFRRQVTSAENDRTANCWSAVRYNATNGWYVNTSNGNCNNNNSYNRYTLLPCPLASAELLFSMLLDAEASCFKNKHQSLTACRVHYHLSELYGYARYIFENGLVVGRSKCFVLDYPILREIFCAFYFDRIMHHLIAPLMTHVAEIMHRRSGGVSHGNRTGHSAFTAALAVQEALRKMTNNWTEKGWVATRDYSGFFMSISRAHAASEFRKYATQVVDVTDKVTAFLTDVVCHYLMADPTVGCVMMSPPSRMDMVPRNKSIRYSRPGFGMPIGNFPSQIIANLFRVGIDMYVTAMEGVWHVVFVDDRMTCAKSQDVLKKALVETEKKSEEYGLITNNSKRYMQQADKGVKFCGYVIKCDRIYISNRVVRAAHRLIDEYALMTDDASEAKLACRLNSYLGIMSHTRSYNIQKDIIDRTLPAHKTLCFVRKAGHFVCRQTTEHTAKFKAIQNIRNFKNETHRLQARACAKRVRRRSCRRMEINSNQ